MSSYDRLSSQQEMSFKAGAEILAVNGESMGTIHRIVIDPGDKRATHLVVRKGTLFSTDRVLPVEVIEIVDGNPVVRSDFVPDDFPLFEEKTYIRASPSDHGYGDEVFYQYPSMLWRAKVPDRSPGRAMVRQSHRNLPEDTVALRVNSIVMSSDGHKLGRLSEVFVHDEDSHLDHIVVTSSGSIGSQQRAVPVGWITIVEETTVHLAIDAVSYEAIPVLDGETEPRAADKL